MKLSADKTTAMVQADGAYTAQELDALMRKLALLRADMRPAVEQSRPGIDDAVLVEDKPGLAIAQRQGGGFRLWLRHRGYGWLAYQIDERSAAGAANFIKGKTAGVEAIDLVGDQGANVH